MAGTVGGRNHSSPVQGSTGFWCHCRYDGGCGGRRGCGRGRRGDSSAVDLTIYPLIIAERALTDSNAAVTGDSGHCLPFGMDRLTDCFGGVDGADQAHEAEDGRAGDTHLADGDEVDGGYKRMFK